jgi:hypothetical protein
MDERSQPYACYRAEAGRVIDNCGAAVSLAGLYEIITLRFAHSPVDNPRRCRLRLQ